MVYIVAFFLLLNTTVSHTAHMAHSKRVGDKWNVFHFFHIFLCKWRMQCVVVIGRCFLPSTTCSLLSFWAKCDYIIYDRFDKPKPCQKREKARVHSLLLFYKLSTNSKWIGFERVFSACCTYLSHLFDNKQHVFILIAIRRVHGAICDLRKSFNETHFIQFCASAICFVIPFSCSNATKCCITMYAMDFVGFIASNVIVNYHIMWNRPNKIHISWMHK